MNSMTNAMAVFYVCLLVIGGVNASYINITKQLKNDIYTSTGYDTSILPRINDTDALIVEISYYLLNLNGVDEVSETITTTSYMNIKWFDIQLIWDPISYDNMTYTFFFQNEIWVPPLTLNNAATPYLPLGHKSMMVTVFNYGVVVWVPFQVFTSTCTMSITYFPFDVQTCSQKFIAWVYSEYEVILSSDAENGIVLNDYSPSPSWEVIGTSWERKSTVHETSITFHLQIQRKPMFVILTIVFPLMLLSVLNICTFLLPCEGGEKAGYAVTIFLAFAVFLTIVQTTLPDNSESISVFSIYVILMTAMSTIITIIVLVENRACAWNTTEVPIPGWTRWLAKVGRKMSCGCGKRKKPTPIVAENVEKSEAWKEDKDEPDHSSPETWSSVICGIDTFCFVVWCIYALLTNIIFLIVVSVGSRANQVLLD